jgi:hypothetical protein
MVGGRHHGKREDERLVPLDFLTSWLLEFLFRLRQMPNGQDLHQNVRLSDE